MGARSRAAQAPKVDCLSAACAERHLSAGRRIHAQEALESRGLAAT